MALSQLLNQNSYILAATTLFLFALIVVIRRFRRSGGAWSALGALFIALIAGNLLLRVGASEIETTAQFDQVLAARQPVLLEIYSNY